MAAWTTVEQSSTHPRDVEKGSGMTRLNDEATDARCRQEIQSQVCTSTRKGGRDVSEKNIALPADLPTATLYCEETLPCYDSEDDDDDATNRCVETLYTAAPYDGGFGGFGRCEANRRASEPRRWNSNDDDDVEDCACDICLWSLEARQMGTRFFQRSGVSTENDVVALAARQVDLETAALCHSRGADRQTLSRDACGRCAERDSTVGDRSLLQQHRHGVCDPKSIMFYDVNDDVTNDSAREAHRHESTTTARESFGQQQWHLATEQPLITWSRSEFMRFTTTGHVGTYASDASDASDAFHGSIDTSMWIGYHALFNGYPYPPIACMARIRL